MHRRRIWIATFNGAECRIFGYDGSPRSLTVLDDGAFSGPRKPEFSDRQTRVYAAASDHRSNAEPPTDPERAMEAAFIADIVTHLADAAHADRFDDLIVAASPRSLGAFRKLAPPELARRVVREIDGDHVKSDAATLLAALKPD